VTDQRRPKPAHRSPQARGSHGVMASAAYAEGDPAPVQVRACSRGATSSTSTAPLGGRCERPRPGAMGCVPAPPADPRAGRVPTGHAAPARGHDGPGRAISDRLGERVQVPSVPMRWPGQAREPVCAVRAGALVTRTRTAEALKVPALIVYRAPADVRGRFREQLHAVNLADPGDPSAPPNAARSWSQPAQRTLRDRSQTDAASTGERTVAMSLMRSCPAPGPWPRGRPAGR